MNFKKIAAWLLVAFSICVAVAQSAPASSLTSNPVYGKNCAKCHGDTAAGRHFRGPSLKSNKVASATAEDLRTIITNGKGHMPKFKDKLSSEQIDDLVQQIEAANKT